MGCLEGSGVPVLYIGRRFLKVNSTLLYYYIQRPSPYRAVHTARLGYKNQSVNAV